MNQMVYVENIISEDERKILYDWIIENKDGDMYVWSKHPGTIRRTTRFTDRVVYPDIAYKIKDRIQTEFNLKSVKEPPYPSGMVATYGYPGDWCELHQDPSWYEDCITYHCIVLLSDIEHGGLSIIADQEVQLQPRDCILYPVSEIPHGSTKLNGNTPRLLWIFGYCVPLTEIDKIS